MTDVGDNNSNSITYYSLFQPAEHRFFFASSSTVELLKWNDQQHLSVFKMNNKSR